MSLKEKVQEIKDRFTLEKNLGVVLHSDWDIYTYKLWIAPYYKDSGFDIDNIKRRTVARDAIEPEPDLPPFTIVQLLPYGIEIPSRVRLAKKGFEPEEIAKKCMEWVKENQEEVLSKLPSDGFKIERYIKS
ncbi:MAG TPA: hypothetical protein VF185_04060 [Patescibacteria group bacterium]